MSFRSSLMDAVLGMNDSTFRSSFLSRGFVAPIRFLSPEEVQNRLGSVDELLTEVDRCSGWRSGYLLNQLHYSFSWAYELAKADSALRAVSRLIGSDLAVWDVAVFRKPSGNGPSWWHQDAFPLTINVDRFVSLWLALTPCDRLHGGLSILPGCNLEGRHELFVQRSVESLLFTGHEKRLPGYSRKVRDIVLHPGEGALLHPWLLHMSHPNRANAARTVVVVRYVSGSVSGLPSFVRKVPDLLPPPQVPIRDLLSLHAQRGELFKSVIEAGFRSVMGREKRRLRSRSALRG